MYFENLAALLTMDGHGPYVWAAYGMTALVLILLIINPLLRKRSLLTQQRMRLRREQASSSSAEPSPAELK
ncbi:heme exporter protein CcmD [Dasania sp. GY-MA-18]|uniref:Heme exporter protein D n=1 Tax=Dasania phycosphaerae TaxID=2950436 RepID=A0A9J6RIC8_9GAMM|nr:MULTISPECIES: heme exporter protein CcmD [Dasania]MCR8921694.1 heme exporter protein CcmD [Dasania sp. GY-MA-18]MCZ0864122.1 heme exporter protein CcmD [Dasania phycosphaerae]MCZ0867850.1 heme exporter protein CcmD [Dasania phycosphaerae]